MIAHTNRGRLTVDLNGDWRLYTNTIPANSAVIGTVTRDGFDTGALVRIERAGVYVQVNAGVLRSLDGRKVAAARGVAGRPAELECGRRRNVYLDDESIGRAKALGNGNISDGIRRALQIATDQSQPGTHQSAR